MIFLKRFERGPAKVGTFNPEDVKTDQVDTSHEQSEAIQNQNNENRYGSSGKPSTKLQAKLMETSISTLDFESNDNSQQNALITVPGMVS